MKRWKITYQYPENYNQRSTTIVIDQKRKPDEIHEKHRYRGVIAVKIEEIAIDRRVWPLKNVLQSMIDTYNTYVKLESYNEEQLAKMLEIIQYLELEIHKIAGEVFRVNSVDKFLYLK